MRRLPKLWQLLVTWGGFLCSLKTRFLLWSFLLPSPTQSYVTSESLVRFFSLTPDDVSLASAQPSVSNTGPDRSRTPPVDAWFVRSAPWSPSPGKWSAMASSAWHLQAGVGCAAACKAVSRAATGQRRKGTANLMRRKHFWGKLYLNLVVSTHERNN